jgi:hypothetical protein
MYTVVEKDASSYFSVGIGALGRDIARLDLNKDVNEGRHLTDCLRLGP